MFVNHIFPIESQWLKEEDNKVAITSQDASVIVCNDSNVSLSLLFQAAVSYAAKDLDVTLICQKQLTSLPKCVHGMPQPDSKTLNTLKFLYLPTAEELTDYCASIHMKSILPDILIIADAHSYLTQGGCAASESTAAKYLALLLDCFNFIKSKKHDSNCTMIVSCLDNLKWMNSVAVKCGFQMMKLMSTEKDGNLEWKTADRIFRVTFKSDREQLFLKEVTETR